MQNASPPERLDHLENVSAGGGGPHRGVLQPRVRKGPGSGQWGPPDEESIWGDAGTAGAFPPDVFREGKPGVGSNPVRGTPGFAHGSVRRLRSRRVCGAA